MSSPSATAIVLVAHGSPDPDWAGPLQATLARMRELDPATPAALAFLTGEPSAAHAVETLAAAGVQRIRLVAAFLSPGGRHIKRDLPELAMTLRAAHPEIQFELVPGALGADPGVVEALARAALGTTPRRDG